MNPENLDNTTWTNRRILWLAAAVAAIVTLVWHAPENAGFIGRRTGELFFVFVMAASITYLLRPSVRIVERLAFRRVKPRAARSWAVVVVVLGAGALLYLFVVVALKPVTRDFVEIGKNFFAQTPAEQRLLIDRWQIIIDNALARFSNFLPKDTRFSIDEQVPVAIATFAPKMSHWAKEVFSHASFVVELLLLPVLVFYFLCDGPAIRREAGLLVPRPWKARAGRIADDLDRVFGGYIRGQVWMCVIAWLIVTIMLLALRVPHAATLGLIAGITRAVPVIGPLLGAIPLVLVCLLTTSLTVTVALLVGFLAMHFLESKVLLPKIIGHEVDLHPVSVIFVLLLGLEFFGFLGVFLAVPIAALLKISLAEWQENQRLNQQMSTVEFDRTASRH